MFLHYFFLLLMSQWMGINGVCQNTDIPVDVYVYEICSGFDFCWYRFEKISPNVPDGWKLREHFRAFEKPFPIQYKEETRGVQRPECGGFTQMITICSVSQIKDVGTEGKNVVEYAVLGSTCSQFYKYFNVLYAEPKFFFYVAEVARYYEKTIRFEIINCENHQHHQSTSIIILHGGAIIANKNLKLDLCGYKGYFKIKTSFYAKRSDICKSIDHLTIPNGKILCYYEQRTSTNRCLIKCDDSFEIAGGLEEFIHCGPDTNYHWSHQLEYRDKEFPSCLKTSYSSGKSNLTFRYVHFNKDCEADYIEKLQSKVKSVLLQVFIPYNELIPRVNTSISSCLYDRKQQYSKCNIESSITYINRRDPLVNCYFAHCQQFLVMETIFLLEEYLDKNMKQIREDARLDGNSEIQSISRSEMEFGCAETGQILKARKLLCVPCSEGYYAAPNYKSKCLPCPKGYYQFKIGETSCFKCPDGFTTVAEASEFLGRCIQI